VTSVWIVEFSEWDEHHNIGVFSSREKAQEFLLFFLKSHPSYTNRLDIEEYDVDAQ
jgi:hypothetical protein